MSPLSDTNTGWDAGGDSQLKFKLILIVLKFPITNMTTKLPYHPPMLGEGIKFKNYVIKK